MSDIVQTFFCGENDRERQRQEGRSWYSFSSIISLSTLSVPAEYILVLFIPKKNLPLTAFLFSDTQHWWDALLGKFAVPEKSQFHKNSRLRSKALSWSSI